MPSGTQSLSVTEKLAYGLGDGGANFIFQAQITFLLFFYTDVFGISAGMAGMILLLSRALDALNDPIIGAIADRTDSRWGKYRPWILWTAFPLAPALILCYTTPELNATGKVVWAIVAYNVLMVLYAANNIPYCALAGVMTDDSSQRTSLASWRFLCAMAATLVVNVFTLDLVKYTGAGDMAAGFRSAMAVWAAIAFLCFLTTFALTTERIRPCPRQHASLRQDLGDLFSSKPWVIVFALGVLINIQLALRSGGILYYFKYYLNREDLFGAFNGVGLSLTMIGVFLSSSLAERFGKRRTFHTCLLLSAVLMASFALVPWDAIWTLFLLQVLLQLAFGPTIPLLWTLMADVADYSEWKTGRRSTALAFASIVFGTKLGLGIGAWMSGEWLHISGYSPAGALLPPASNAIVMTISVLPATALLIGLIILFLYPIDNSMEQQIRESLRASRENTHGAGAR